MQLTLDQLRAVTTGAVTVRPEEDGVRFYRFTDRQMAAFDQTHLHFTESRLRTAAGVKLSFRTDSRTLTLRAGTSLGSGRSYYSFDLVVDGELRDSLDNFSHLDLPAGYAEGSYQRQEGEKRFDLGAGEKTVCLHFPWSVRVCLRELSLDDGARIEPVIPKEKFLVFGDSITQGYDVLHPSRRHIARLADALGMEEFNKAVGGSYTAPGLARERDEFDPALILVGYGTNDWTFCRQEQMRENYAALLTALRNNYPGVPCACLTPIWRAALDETRKLGAFSEAARIIRETAADFSHVTVIDCFDFIPHEPAMFGDLILHPNETGSDRYFNALYPALRTLLHRDGAK